MSLVTHPLDSSFPLRAIRKVEDEQVVLRWSATGLMIAIICKGEMPWRLRMTKDPAREPVVIIEGGNDLET